VLFQEQRAGKATNFIFCTHIHRIDRNKSPVKNSGKVAVGLVVRDSRTLSGHPYIGRITRSSLRQLSFLVINNNIIAFIGCGTKPTRMIRVLFFSVGLRVRRTDAMLYYTS